MFDRTQAISKKIVADLKRDSFIISLITQLMFIAYYVYSIVAKSGYLVVNIILLCLAAVYFVFYIVIYAKGKGKTAKKIKRGVKTVYRYIKYALHAFTLGMALYVLYSERDTATFLNILLVVLNAVGFLAQILVEVIRQVFTRYFRLMQTAVVADVQPYIDMAHKLQNPRSAMVEAVNKPMEALAKKFANKMGIAEPEAPKPDKIEQRVDEIAAAYDESEERKEKNKQKKLAERQEAAEQLKDNMRLIGQGVKYIFSKKKDAETKELPAPAEEETE